MRSISVPASSNTKTAPEAKWATKRWPSSSNAMPSGPQRWSSPSSACAAAGSLGASAMSGSSQKRRLLWARELAALIPDSRLVSLESRNHILTSFEPAWAVFLDEVDRFLA